MYESIKQLNMIFSITKLVYNIISFHIQRLESGITIKDKDYYVDAGHQENKQKNRFLNILPYDKNRVKLVPIAGCRQSDYINASMTDGFQKRNAFIATQAPLENTVNDFWRMIVEQNVHIIVMLTKLEEKGQVISFTFQPNHLAASEILRYLFLLFSYETFSNS